MANDVSSSLAQVDLLHGSVLTVTLDVAGATITALNVHGFQGNGAGGAVPELNPALLPGEEFV